MKDLAKLLKKHFCHRVASNLNCMKRGPGINSKAQTQQKSVTRSYQNTITTIPPPSAPLLTTIAVIKIIITIQSSFNQYQIISQ